ncbi:hypothetical protein HYX18_04390, partial [Candidatus Woesearchaeota archaeon]|nr:hypothetical protein [Candidatus Woesearchaeota archaeon]
MKKEGFVLILLLGVVFSFTNVNALTLQEECNNFCASAPYALDNCVGGNEFNSWSYRYGYHKRSQTYAMLDESGNIDTIGDFLCDCSVQGNDGELVSCDPVVAYDAATDSPILDRNGFLCNVLLGYNIFATRGYCKPTNSINIQASCKNVNQIPQQDRKCFVYVLGSYLVSDCIYDYWGGYPNILLNGPSSNYKNTSLKNYLDRYQDPGAFPYDSRCNPDGDGCYEYLDYAISEAFQQCERGEHQCPGNVHPNICQSGKNITKYVCEPGNYLGSYSPEPLRCDIPNCWLECGSGIRMNPDQCSYYDASCIETFDGSHCGAKNVVDLDTDQQLCESTCPYDPADPSISAPLKWAASGVNQQFGEYSRIGQVACCGDDPDEVVATSATITRCCKPNQRVDSNGNCYYDFGGATCTDTDSTTYPTVNRDLRGTASSGTNSFTDTCEPPPSTSVREYYCQTPSDTQVLSVVYPCLNPCLNGQCAAPVFCKLINAYWTKDYTKPSSPSPWRVLNNSDTALVLIGEDCPTTLSVNFSIWESDCTGSITLDNNGVPTCSGGITLKKGTSSIINFDSTGKTFVNWRTTTEADNDNNYIDADGFDSN